MSDIPKVGDQAPGFEAETYGGEKIKLSDIDMLGYFTDISLLGPINEVCKKIKTAGFSAYT